MRPRRALVLGATLAALAGSGACATHQDDHPGTGEAVESVKAPRAGTTGIDWPGYHGDAARTGYSARMPAAQGSPRVARTVALDGAVYASPIVGAGRTIVATENDTVYAFDRHGRLLWRRHLGTPTAQSRLPCGNIFPLGITGTPVYVARTKSVYVVAEHGPDAHHTLVSLAVGTGKVRWHRSVDRPGVEQRAMQERGALAVTGGRVWVPFGGLAGDCGGYKGRVVGVPLSGHGSPRTYTVPTRREAGIWTPPGPSVDAKGRLYVAVGNGESGPGDPYDHSDSVLRLTPDGRLAGSFSPTTWPTDNAADLDLGSQGPALVGRWVFSAGKSGTAYVLSRRRLGGIGGQVSQGSVCKSFGGTAVVGSVVYVPCTDGLRAVRIDGSGRMQVLWHAAGDITGSPVVGGGRVWSLDPSNGTLYALDPATGRTVSHVSVGTTSRFATPALSGSALLVPTLAGMTVVATS